MSDDIELLSKIISLMLANQNSSKMVLYYDRQKLKNFYGLQISINNDYITLINKKKSDK